MEPTHQNQIKREVATKTRIKEIVEGKYIKEEGWKPNYIMTLAGEVITRVNLIGVVVSDPTIEENNQNLTLDDGSGKIMLRSFENGILLGEYPLGNVINIIGKPREYLGSKYIIPEIIKKINNNHWLEVRKKELEIKEKQNKDKMKNENPPKKEENFEEVVIEEEGDTDKIIKLVKKLDNGEGVLIEDLIKKSQNPETEKIISSLMEQGEIFEIQPGKIKVLE